MKTVRAIALITVKEAFRSRFVGFLTIFALLIVASSSVFSYFSVQEQMKLIKDIGLAGITVFSLLIGLVLASFVIPLEEEQKTIYHIRTNRIAPFSYILGRFAGIASFLFLVILFLSLVFYLNIGLKLWMGSVDTIAPSRYESLVGVKSTYAEGLLENLVLLKAIGMIYLKVVLLASITLLLSLWASVTLNFALSLIVFIGGHLTYILSDVAGQFGFLPRCVMLAVYYLFPNFEHFNIADSIVVGKKISLTYLWMAAGYGVFYLAAVLVLAGFLFDRKEV